ISHAIKWYICIGYDITEESDIVAAAYNLSGICLANIKPNQNQEKNKSLVAKNKGEKNYMLKLLQGYLIASLCNNELYHPEPKTSTYTKPQS
ncbi:1511_t:CDS:2, partial [Racocetra persica]